MTEGRPSECCSHVIIQEIKTGPATAAGYMEALVLSQWQWQHSRSCVTTAQAVLLHRYAVLKNTRPEDLVREADRQGKQAALWTKQVSLAERRARYENGKERTTNCGVMCTFVSDGRVLYLRHTEHNDIVVHRNCTHILVCTFVRVIAPWHLSTFIQH